MSTSSQISFGDSQQKVGSHSLTGKIIHWGF